MATIAAFHNYLTTIIYKESNGWERVIYAACHQQKVGRDKSNLEHRTLCTYLASVLEVGQNFTVEITMPVELGEVHKNVV